MWRLIAKPDVLVFLQVSFEVSTARRRLDWTVRDYREELRRLEHARLHADLVVDTDPLTAQEVLRSSLEFLASYLPGGTPATGVS
jgi:hypothetical protein